MSGLLSNATYYTTFSATEAPLSEGGLWIQGQANGLDWCNINMAGGIAYGTENGTNSNTGIGVTPSQYDDSTAILRGSFAPDQYVEATIQGVGNYGTSSTEVELRLRTAIWAHWISGIEVELGLNFTNSAGTYFDLVRWNGAVADFTPMVHLGGSTITTALGRPIADGDKLRAEAVGNTVTVWINSALITSSTDASWGTLVGNPGIGAYYFKRDTAVDTSTYGFTDFFTQPVLSMGDPENYGRPEGLRGQGQVQQLLAV